jgi:hypothetical protein
MMCQATGLEVRFNGYISDRNGRGQDMSSDSLDIDLLRKDFLKNGFCNMPVPSEDEQQWLHQFVEDKWIESLKQGCPEIALEAEGLGLGRYHEISHKINHSSFWTKDQRIFTSVEVDKIIGNLSVFKSLEKVFGDFEVEDIEGIGYSEIYWRLVRPNCDNDVAVAHKDSWFYSITNHMSSEQQAGIVKVWLPVIAPTGNSGLSVFPGTHKIDIPYASEVRHGREKPTGDTRILESFPQKMLPLEVGQAVAFDKELLHKGLAHKGNLTRVSIEFAIRLTKY